MCCPVGDSSIPKLERFNIFILQSDDPNIDLLSVIKTFKNEKVFSINNKYILNNFLLNSGSEFFNIHNGLVQRYRGIAEICIFAAICNGEPTYGVTLHKLLPNQKVDSGPVIDQLAFGIEPSNNNFSSVITRSLDESSKIFRENIVNIIYDKYLQNDVELFVSAYSYRDVPQIRIDTDPDLLAKASDLGVYGMFFPRLEKILCSLSEIHST